MDSGTHVSRDEAVRSRPQLAATEGSQPAKPLDSEVPWG